MAIPICALLDLLKNPAMAGFLYFYEIHVFTQDKSVE